MLSRSGKRVFFPLSNVIRYSTTSAIQPTHAPRLRAYWTVVLSWCVHSAQTALVLRFGEKRVLHRTVELVSQVWSMLLVEGWHD